MRRRGREQGLCQRRHQTRRGRRRAARLAGHQRRRQPVRQRPARRRQLAQLRDGPVHARSSQGGTAPTRSINTVTIYVAGVGLRLSRHVNVPQLMHVRACGRACPESDPRRHPGMAAVGDGSPARWMAAHSTGGRYRYGDLAIAAPPDNPGPAGRPRAPAGALKRALWGPETGPLNWSAGTRITSWEG